MQKERDEIRILLYRNNLTSTWLINQLDKKGISVDKSELSSALAGSRKGAKIEKVISESLNILHRYEDKMNTDDIDNT